MGNPILKRLKKSARLGIYLISFIPLLILKNNVVKHEF